MSERQRGDDFCEGPLGSSLSPRTGGRVQQAASLPRLTEWGRRSAYANFPETPMSRPGVYASSALWCCRRRRFRRRSVCSACVFALCRCSRCVGKCVVELRGWDPFSGVPRRTRWLTRPAPRRPTQLPLRTYRPRQRRQLRPSQPPVPALNRCSSRSGCTGARTPGAPSRSGRYVAWR